MNVKLPNWLKGLGAFLLLVAMFILGIFAGKPGKPIPGANTIKQLDNNNAKLASDANAAVGQLKADNAAIGASSTVMDGLVQSGSNLVDQSKSLIDEATRGSAKSP